MRTTRQPPRADRYGLPWHAAMRAIRHGAVAAGCLWALAAQADIPAIFRDADLALGEQLIRQHRCSQCHAEKVGGDGSAIYRPLGRVNTAGLLRGMVEQCNSALNLQMWPEEVTAVAAVLNRDHYRFKD
ncbi:hypothetical protein [Tepidimonas charontis]|uniref:Green heme protein n=1 Tax=Tepidimonas charontis TaxID=2267262 RepID=A0A554XGV6_9BURK|nr:hypothetical protein [Tepidimonas charontis]TSE35063.1 Green heme protein [Tepidimonas charontis]